MSTAAAEPRSAYPVPVEDLLPRARQLAMRAGEVPSQRRIKDELHVGMPKAKQLHAILTAEANPAPEPTEPAPPAEPDPDPVPAVDPEPAAVDEPVSPVPDSPGPARRRRVPVWPVLLLTLPALAAIWSGWVSLGGMAGFGVVHPLPGIADHVTFNTAITLPIGVEVYAAYALYVWLAGAVPDKARKFARSSAVLALCVGAAGQVTYHLLAAAGVTRAPWPVVTLVACLPVAVLGMGAALAHLVHSSAD
jgi:hypothetical protein